jgi:signal transduction histidine kinase
MAPEGESRASRAALRAGAGMHAARLSALGALSASIAHEISQRLGAILANVDAAELILDREAPDLDDLRHILRDIRTDDLGVGDIIGRMRALFRRQPPALVPLDLNRTVADALRIVAHEARRQQVTIVAEAGAGLPRIAGDEVQLQQVVINLVANAMDAVRGRPGAELHVRTAGAPGGVELCVADTGPGVPADSVERLFDAFFSTKPDGTGLGLWIVRGIVEAHRGRVWVESALPSGAVFRVWLPALEGVPG